MCLVLGGRPGTRFVFFARSDWLLVSGELHLPPPVCREETPLHGMTWLSLSDNGGSPAVGCASESCLCTSGGEHVDTLQFAAQREERLWLATGGVSAHPAANGSLFLRGCLIML